MNTSQNPEARPVGATWVSVGVVWGQAGSSEACVLAGTGSLLRLCSQVVLTLSHELRQLQAAGEQAVAA